MGLVGISRHGRRVTCARLPRLLQIQDHRPAAARPGAARGAVQSGEAGRHGGGAVCRRCARHAVVQAICAECGDQGHAGGGAQQQVWGWMDVGWQPQLWRTLSATRSLFDHMQVHETFVYIWMDGIRWDGSSLPGRQGGGVKGRGRATQRAKDVCGCGGTER
eukprot:364849-Chlamydomonas_euryale.AAC.16